MASKVSMGSFLECLRDSGLVEQDRLQAVLAEATGAAGAIRDPRALADVLIERGLLTGWQVENLMRGKRRGFMLGKYKLLSLLGRGGMSSVYLAEHALMRRRCAIKVLPAKSLGGSSNLGRFHREARAVASLDHTNIVRAYDVDKAMDGDTEIHFFVMEYVDGESLQDRVSQKGPLKLVDAVDFIRQTAEGLAHAHRAGIIHRDIKPANLLVDRDGVVKILDLGLAKLFDDPAQLPGAQGDHMVGTADFLSPEQALDSQAVDARTDIYSLGCSLYCLLAGHAPFPEGTLPERLVSHQTKRPVPITEKRKDVDPELNSILHRMTAKDPRERIQTAIEIAELLRRWLLRHADREWVQQHPALLGGSGAVSGDGDFESLGPPATEPQTPATPARQSPVEAKPAGSRPPTDGARDDARSKSRRQAAASATGAAVSHKAPVKTVTGAPAPPDSRGDRVSAAEAELQELLRAQSSHSAHATLGTRRRPPGLSKRIQAAWIRGSTRRLMMGGAIVCAAALLIGLFAWLSAPPSSGPSAAVATPNPHDGKTAVASERAAAPTVRPPLSAEVTVGPKGRFKTIAEALDYVRDARRPADGRGATIQVAGWQTYRESIVIDGASLRFPKGLQIVGDPSGRPVLASEGARAAIRLKDVDGLTIEGFEIESDQRPAAIELSGYVSSTRLRNIEIRHINRAGVAIRDARGFDTPQLRCLFERIDFRGSDPKAVGVLIENELGAPASLTVAANLTLAGCRFFGPFDAAICIAGPVVGIELRDSIVSRAASAIEVRGRKITLRDVAVVNNTFHRVDRALLFHEMPDAGSGGLIVRRNLFSDSSGPELYVERGFNGPAFLSIFGNGGVSDNWTSRASKGPRAAGEVDLFTSHGKSGAQLQFQSTDPSNPRFLEPLPTASHRAIGALVAKNRQTTAARPPQ